MWDKRHNKLNWCHEIRAIFSELDDSHSFLNSTTVSLNWAWGILFQKYIETWKRDLLSKPKLRTYIKCKNMYSLENYVTLNMAPKYRSALAKLRCGILPLELETGRYHNIEESQWLCKLCQSGSIENEYHFLFDCHKYEDHRRVFYRKIETLYPNFLELEPDSRFAILMNADIVRDTAKFVYEAFCFRQNCIYNHGN